MILVAVLVVPWAVAFALGYWFRGMCPMTPAGGSPRAGSVLHSGRHLCRPPRGDEPELGEDRLLIMPDWHGDEPIAVDDDGWVCPGCGASWTAKVSYGSLTWVKDARPLGNLA